MSFVNNKGFCCILVERINIHHYRVAKMAEVSLIWLLPSWLVRQKLLNPMLTQTGGTILGAKLASQYGWAINLGGGYHHCSACSGGGFCMYADISLSIKYYQNYMLSINGKKPKILIVDLDAHQGNGHENDFGDDDSVVIMDVYNEDIYPHDYKAARSINIKKAVRGGIGDQEYLSKVEEGLKQAYEEWTNNENGFDLLIYNAGTDCLQGDPLGDMNVTAEGIKKRDEMVWNTALSNNTPILMVLSGGYLRGGAQVIANSIENLSTKFNILNSTRTTRLEGGK